jgi:hypothetical protein
MAGKCRFDVWGFTSVAKVLAQVALMGALTLSSLGQETSGQSQTPPGQQSEPATAGAHPALPHGKKLMLKDGTFQLVREYKVEGDRVRFYSMDSMQWDELPASMVDWEATKRVEMEEARRGAAVVEKARVQEQARQAEALDIDASLEVAPGVFLPPGEALFVFDGKAVLQLSQAETNSKFSKGQFLKQVLVPVPIVPTRHTISIKKAHAALRIDQTEPEFYMRTADAREPEMELIRAKVRGDVRQIENLDELFKQQIEKADTLPLQRWEVARGVYRFTLGHALEPGEYALAEIVQGTSMSLYVWDFGVGSIPEPAPRTK